MQHTRQTCPKEISPTCCVRSYTPLSLILSAVIVLAFWRLVYCGFVTYDDPLYVTSNDQLRMGLSRGGIAFDRRPRLAPARAQAVPQSVS